MPTPDKLLSARLKLERAEKHITDLDATLGAFKASNPCTIGTKRDSQTRCPIYYVQSFRAVPTEIAIIAGDAIFNLRSALDHTAMQLWIDGGRNGREKDIAFPIFDSAAKYHAGKPGKVKGLRNAAIKALDAIEPYQTGNGHALWVLHELNIIDKHRLLLAIGGAFKHVAVPVTPPARVAGSGWVEAAGMFLTPQNWKCPLETGDELFIGAPDDEFDEKICFTIEIAFGEPQVPQRDSVLKTLRDTSKFVQNIVDQLGRLL